MHCPKCGQQQSSGDVRFCSRCGFPLEGVAVVIANNGLLPPAPTHAWDAAAPSMLSSSASAAAAPTVKQQSIRRGSKFVFWSVALLPIFFGFSIATDSPGPLIVPFTIFMIGILQIVYAWLYGEELLPGRRRRAERAAAAAAQEFLRSQMPGAGGRSALPPSQSAPVTAGQFRPRVTTAEIVEPPPSVTEQTTRLLDDQ